MQATIQCGWVLQKGLIDDFGMVFFGFDRRNRKESTN